MICDTSDSQYCETIVGDTILNKTVKSCPIGQSCTKGSLGPNFTLLSECENTKHPSGESCSMNEDCLSSLSENSTCTPIENGKDYNSNGACKNTSFCNKVCKTLLKPGESCSYDSQCEFNLGCTVTQNSEIPVKRSVRYFSIRIGNYSTNPLTCETGYTDYNNICSSTSVDEEKKECTVDSDCWVAEYNGNEIIETTSRCNCNWADPNKKYCEYSSNSTEYQKCIKAFKKDHTTAKTTKIHISYYKEKTSNYELRKAEFNANVQTLNLPDCAVNYLLNSNMIKCLYQQYLY